MTREATVLIVPGLRAHVPQHWQTLLASRLPRVRTVEPMGRDDLDCARRVAAIEREANAIKGPLLLVAHSGGVLMVVHWARQTQRVVHGALLATPPDFERAMPESILPAIKWVAALLTTIAMAALGLGVDVRVVARSGVRVTLAVTVSLIVLAAMSYGFIRLMGMP